MAKSDVVETAELSMFLSPHFVISNHNFPFYSIEAIKQWVGNDARPILSSVANRQNETMRVLSIVATMMLPLTLVAGIYGMNFEYMPELRWPWGLFRCAGIHSICYYWCPMVVLGSWLDKLGTETSHAG
jgi:hypothetical protein